MAKHFSIHQSEGEQASLLWPVHSSHGNIGVLKIVFEAPLRRDVRVQAIIWKAIRALEALGHPDPGELIVQVFDSNDASINLVRIRHTAHWAPGLTWHRGTQENLVEALGINPAFLGCSDWPMDEDLQVFPGKSYPTQRYLLLNEDDVQAHFDWPVPSAHGDIAVLTVREPYKERYSQRSEDLTIRTARLIFERMGVLVSCVVTHTFQPHFKEWDQPETWAMVWVMWPSVGKTSTPEPEGVWNFTSKPALQSFLTLSDEVLDADRPYFDAPPHMPAAREIMSTEKRVQARVEQDADSLLDCLERIGATLEQGRSVGFQVGLSEGAVQMMIARHGARAERILANCTRL
ncbi:hypothetical protein IFT48_03085 [Pseudomonas fluorescens]|uniref:hypothetical protein n=1 Tax=Pseudomonas fluorescens TaxID=294 RepID=UPI001930D786|nr:hypothetical protein [Pseudomonas fluorescens]MBD8088952.1 hypothetical protein [Pseudomonas fluorescens]